MNSRASYASRYVFLYLIQLNSVLIAIWSVLTSSSAAFSVKTQAAKSYSTLELTTMNALTLKWRRLLKSSITSTTTTSQDWSCTTAAASNVTPSSPVHRSDSWLNGTSVHHHLTHVPSVVRYILTCCIFNDFI